MIESPPPSGGELSEPQLSLNTALLEAEARLRLALEAARMGTWDWDVRSGVVRWSKEAEVIFGIPPGGFGGTLDSVIEHIHRDDRDAVRQAIDRTFAEPSGRFQIDHRVTAPSDENRWVEARGQLYRDPEGQPVRMVGVVADISPRKRAEAALRESEERWRMLSDATFEGIGFSRDGVLVDSSPQLAAMLGYTVADLIGIGMPAIVAEDSREVVEANQRSGREDAYVHLARRKDGTTFPVEARGRSVVYRGHPTRLTAIRDVSERFELEARLRGAAQEWRDCFDALPIGILLVDAEGRIRRVNRAALRSAGFDRFEDLQRRLLKSLGPGEPWTTLSEMAAGGAPVPEREIRDAVTQRSYVVGAETSVLMEGSPSTVLHFQDVTEIAALRERVRSQETFAAFGALLAGVAHEVRNPLFSISVNLDAFEALGDRSSSGKMLGIVRREVVRLNSLMNELLEYGKPADGAPERRAFGELLADAVQGAYVPNATASVRLVTALDDVPAVSVRSDRMRRVFQNLIENAMQHAPPGSEVHVSAAIRGDGSSKWIECAVEDSGPGIAAKDLGRLFDPFFSRRRGGTGLGLSLVQKIVAEHGGKVTAANRPEGGASFRVVLPVAEE